MKKLFWVLFACLILLVGCAGRYDPMQTPDTLPAETPVELTDVAVTEPLPPDTTLSFVACGDNIMYTGSMRDAKSQALPGGRTYNFAPFYEHIRSIIEEADIAFINQETPMAGEDFGYGSYPHFNSPQDLAYDLVETGYDIVNIANNHMLDAGSAGLVSTIEFWQTMPVTLLGGHLNEEDFSAIRVYEKDDVRIAFLAYTYSTNGLKVKTGYDLYIPYLDEDLIERQVAEARRIADLVFVSVHWGNENNMTPNSTQTDLAAKMADWGVDVILGHHPHVIQPIEWLDGQNGHKTLCVYSLGNFVAEQAHDYNLLGGIMTFDIVRQSGALSIENPQFLPTVYYYSKSFYKNSVHLLENFDASMAASIGLSYYGQSTSLARLYGFAQKTIAPEFLPAYVNDYRP